MELIAEKAVAAVRGRRIRAGITAEQMATAARDVGFGWRQSTVAELERGNRKLTGEELLHLPVIARRAGLEDVENLTDLLPEHWELLAGHVYNDPAMKRLIAKLGLGNIRRSVELWADVSPNAYELAEQRGIIDEAAAVPVQKIARSFGVSPGRVVMAAHNVFGRGVVAERDARVGDADTPRSAQALRGHAVRAIKQELADELDDADVRYGRGHT